MKNNSQILGNLVGKDVTVEENCYIGEDTTIISNHIHIKKNTTIKGLKAILQKNSLLVNVGILETIVTLNVFHLTLVIIYGWLMVLK